MTSPGEPDGFHLALAAVPACSLDEHAARAQRERYHAVVPFVTDVRLAADGVVVGFTEDVDEAAVDAAITVERQCCGGVLDFEFDRQARSLRVAASDPALHPALEQVANGFRQGVASSSGRRRRIGPIGTTVRALLGLALLTLAYLNRPAELVGGLQLHVLLIGLVALPAASVTVGLLARRFRDGPLRVSRAGTAVNVGVLVALFADHYTAGGAALFYGATLLLAAWRGESGCEFTALSNALLGREDEIGCPVLSPIDAREGRHRPHGSRGPCRSSDRATTASPGVRRRGRSDDRATTASPGVRRRRPDPGAASRTG